MAACCIWSGSKDPSTPWYCCLDCQEKDFEGWPAENKDIPLKVMSRALRNAMIERVCCIVCVMFGLLYIHLCIYIFSFILFAYASHSYILFNFNIY